LNHPCSIATDEPVPWHRLRTDQLHGYCVGLDWTKLLFRGIEGRQFLKRREVRIQTLPQKAQMGCSDQWQRVKLDS